jgi:outer membrane murein-binding lipoprotein Lpp
MKTTAIHLFLSVVVGVLIVGGAYHIMETITPETSAVKQGTLTSVSTNNEQYTSLAPTVHQAKPYKHTAHSTSAKATNTTAVPLYTHSQQAKQHAHNTSVIAHSHDAQTHSTQPQTQPTQQQAIAMVSQHSAVSMPFSAMAPRVIAASGDIQPFKNQAPRKAPPTTGGQNPENTDIIVPQPLPDGSIFLLLLIIGYAVSRRSFKLQDVRTISKIE